MRISDEYAANILRTALFTVIVRYIFTSCREYPANKVGLTKKCRASDFFQDWWAEVTHGAKNGGSFSEMMGPSVSNLPQLTLG